MLITQSGYNVKKVQVESLLTCLVVAHGDLGRGCQAVGRGTSRSYLAILFRQDDLRIILATYLHRDAGYAIVARTFAPGLRKGVFLGTRLAVLPGVGIYGVLVPT